MVAARYVTFFFSLVVGAACPLRLEAAQARAVMQVSATIVDSARVRSVQHVQSVLVTEQDIGRGFVDVPYGSRVALNASPHCVIELAANGSFFRSVMVRSPYGGGRLEANGPVLRQRACGGGAANVDFNYRFELDPAVQPGLYRWPISAMVLPS